MSELKKHWDAVLRVGGEQIPLEKVSHSEANERAVKKGKTATEQLAAVRDPFKFAELVLQQEVPEFMAPRYLAADFVMDAMDRADAAAYAMRGRGPLREQVREALRVTLPSFPGVEVHVMAGRGVVVAAMPVRDVRDPHRREPVTISTPNTIEDLDRYRTREARAVYVAEQAKRALLELFEHEIDECLEVDGVRALPGPHSPRARHEHEARLRDRRPPEPPCQYPRRSYDEYARRAGEPARYVGPHDFVDDPPRTTRGR